MKTAEYYHNHLCTCDRCSNVFEDDPSKEEIIIYRRQYVGEGVCKQMVHVDLCPACQLIAVDLLELHSNKYKKPDFTNHDGSHDYD